MRVQRVLMPSGVESATLLNDGVVVEPVEPFLAHLTSVERSPNTPAADRARRDAEARAAAAETERAETHAAAEDAIAETARARTELEEQLAGVRAEARRRGGGG